ncbi:hypothetical protein GCM10010286_44550 [Streptomyces toxytricini]|nr:hypothetical protein GCM10010286_44550 [Streptomyces toxytricini]
MSRRITRARPGAAGPAGGDVLPAVSSSVTRMLSVDTFLLLQKRGIRELSGATSAAVADFRRRCRTRRGSDPRGGNGPDERPGKGAGRIAPRLRTTGGDPAASDA